MDQPSESLKITKRKIRSIGSDPEKTAKAINLVYVTDTQPGISRVKNGDKYDYFFKNKKIEDDEELLRIKHLVLPPAWENVWICKLENGHLRSFAWLFISPSKADEYLLSGHFRFHGFAQFIAKILGDRIN